jgi:hypothetical protein
MEDVPRDVGCPHMAQGSLLADPRNEDNLIVAQILVGFMKLHNQVIDALEAEADTPEKRDPVLQFNTARRIVTEVYRAVIVNDYLPRLLDPEVWEDYQNCAEPADFVFASDLARGESAAIVPAEFSFGVMRFGHAMIRSKYNFSEEAPESHLSEILAFRPGGAQADQIPMHAKWVLDWERFFFAPDAQDDVNKARGIVPAQAPPLSEGWLAQRLDPPYADEDTLPASLMYRDLVRGYQHHLPTGQRMAELLGIPEERRLENSPHYMALLDSLQSERPIPGLDFGELFYSDSQQEQFRLEIEDNMPLFLYVLLEAEAFHGGDRLGPVGSTVVAEVLCALMLAVPSLSDAERESSAALFKDGVFPNTIELIMRNFK